MFGFIKKCFFTAMTFFSLSNVNILECVSMNNQECKIRTEIININTNIPAVFKQTDAKAVVTQSITYMLKYAFPTKLKT